jgi:peptide-methionine (S)-S-oxide reductase
VVSFQTLVDVFFDNHLWTTNTSRRQYRNIAFFHDDEQKQIIKDKIALIQDENSVVVMTEVAAVTPFYYAEDYHQKWELRKRDDLSELFRGWNNLDFINSTAAAKLNAHVGNSISSEQVLEDLEQFDLSTESKKELESILKGKKKKWFW